MSPVDSVPQVLAWLATYVVHSTVLLGLAWFLTRPARARSPRFVERTWRLGVIGPLVTATVASLFPHAPVLGVIALEPERPSESALVLPRAQPAHTEALAPGSAEPTPVRAASRIPHADEHAAKPRRTALPAPLLCFVRLAGLLQDGALEQSAPTPPAARRTRLQQPAAPPRASLTSPRRDRAVSARGASSLEDAPASDRDTAPSRRDERGQRAAADSATNAAATTHRSAGGANAARLSALVERLPRLTWSELTLVLWTSPALVLAVALVCSALRLGWDLRRRREVRDAALLARFDALRRETGLARPVRLSSSTRLRGPITFGVLRPEVTLPERALRGLRPAHERSMFAHELAHVVRRDPAWFAALALFERVLFFQPLLRVARKRLVEVAEERADDMAVSWTGDRLALASCLAEIARWILDGRERRAPALPIAGMASSRLGHRIERLLVPDPPVEPRHGWFTPLALALLVTTAGAAPRVRAAARPEPEAPPTRRSALTAAPAKAVPASTPAASVALEPSPGRLPVLSWEGVLLGEYALLEEELELLGAELALLETELGHQSTHTARATHATLAALTRRHASLNTMRAVARDLLLEALHSNTSRASTPRALETALEPTQR